MEKLIWKSIIHYNQQPKHQRIYTKTLNHSELIDYDIIKNCTTPANPICIVDVLDYKYVVIDSSIFKKATICNIEIPSTIIDRIINFQSVDYDESNDIMEFISNDFYIISSIVEWVKHIFIMPWGKHKQKTIIKYTYPTM